MDPFFKSLRTGFVIVSAAIFFPSLAKADGGVMRMMETKGRFTITFFTPTEISRNLPTEIAVMVQRTDTGNVIMDAEVDLDFVPPTDARIQSNNPTPIRATRDHSANKLFYGATAVFPSVGDWQVRASVRQGDEDAAVTCILPVGMPPRHLRTLWPYLVLPPLVIALFVMNQWLRRRRA